MEYPVQGVGLGLRRGMFAQLAEHAADVGAAVDFMEVAPENWIGVGGRFGRQFRSYAERFPLVCHGLSLSLGSPSPLDTDLLRNVKAFLDTFNVRCYTEHLSYCSDHGQLYDLMPIPFTAQAVEYVAGRIQRTQDVLERRIAVEHVSCYATPGQEMSELEFVNAVIDRADCDLLLDVNNIYVNSVNHRYDPFDFLRSLPLARVRYLHVAGHYDEAEDLKVDTHGARVIEPVWDLLAESYRLCGPLPTLLERDFNLPPLPKLLAEVERIRALQHAAASAPRRDSA